MFSYQVALFLAATIIIPCVIGVTCFRRLPVYFKLIVMLLLFGLFTESVLITLPYFGINNFSTSHIYALVEIVLLSLFFIALLKSSAEKKIIRITMTGMSAFALMYAIIGNNMAEFNSMPRALECIYFSGLSCYVFYEMSIDPEPVDSGVYFVNGGILFYFTSCFLIFAFSKYKAPDYKDLLVMFDVHSIVNAMCNVAYATGLWIASRSSYLPA